MASLTNYKSNLVASKFASESLSTVRVGDTVSVNTVELGTIFAKVKSVTPTTLTFQRLRHNFESTSELVKISSSDIISIKHISVKRGLGTILK